MGKRGGKGGRERREGEGRGRGGEEHVGGRTHACPPVPALPPDVQPTVGTPCVGAQTSGSPRVPAAAAFPPCGFWSIVSLAAALGPACSCSPSALPVPPLFLLSRLLPRVSFPPPRPRGETLPPALSRCPGVLKWGGPHLDGAFPTVPVGGGGAFQQPLPARGVHPWAPDDRAGSGWGFRGSGGRMPAGCHTGPSCWCHPGSVESRGELGAAPW